MCGREHLKVVLSSGSLKTAVRQQMKYKSDDETLNSHISQDQPIYGVMSTVYGIMRTIHGDSTYEAECYNA